MSTAARRRARVRRLTEATTTKTENGSQFPAAAYAYVPDPTSPSTWKLRLWETPELKVTAKQVGAALAALSPGGFRGNRVKLPASAMSSVKKKIATAWRSVHPDADASDLPAVLKESFAGGRTANDLASFLTDQLQEDFGAALYLQDWDDESVIFRVWDNDDAPTAAVLGLEGAGTYKVGYTLDPDGEDVTFDLPAAPVQQQTTWMASEDDDDTANLTEAEDRLEGRVVEARGTAGDGGRIFEVQILRYGQSKNGNRYRESVMRKAVPLYEGAKAYDHHRTEAELRTSTITGLVGHYQDVAAEPDGLYGQLHLLPGANHTAEALDATLKAQEKGLEPIVGISHDVAANYKNVVDNGQRLVDATEIVKVFSADVVADPSAGGRVTRMVAGGNGDTEPPEGTVNLQQLLALLRDADATKRAELFAEHKDLLTEWNLEQATVERMVTAMEPPEGGTGSGEGSATGTPEGGAGGTETEPAAGGGGAATITEPTYAKESVAGKRLVRDAVEDRNLPDRLVEAISKRLPDRFTEADVSERLDVMQESTQDLERLGLLDGGKIKAATVTKDAQDKKVDRLDKFFQGNFTEGYRSFKQAFCDFTGRHEFEGGAETEDFNRLVLKESIGNPLDMYDSGTRRMSESVSSTTWNLALGDSITRRLVAEYQRPNLQTWQAVTSSIAPINDFRTQRIDRIGGYGVLPTVSEGGDYQPLTTPGNEEVTYAIAKKGGTEDLTLETIANDDIRFISRIPQRLGYAASRTLHNAVWDVLFTNEVCSYDSVALFNSAHANTQSGLLSEANMRVLRAAMRTQTAYGDLKDILSLTPKALVVPPQLEGLGFEICNGAWAVPSTEPGATNVPNLHQGTQLVVVDYDTDTNDWFLVADGMDCPLVEVGFYQGRQDPELFSQTDPTTGAVFQSDKITYKIRHIWGLAILDHRGFQRASN